MKVNNIKNLAVEVQQLMNDNVSFATRYRLNKLYKDVQIIIEQIEETRIGLLEQYATLNEEQNKYEFSSDVNAEKFSKEYAEKLEEDIQLDYTFNVEEFSKVTGSDFREIFELIVD